MAPMGTRFFHASGYESFWVTAVGENVSLFSLRDRACDSVDGVKSE